MILSKCHALRDFGEIWKIVLKSTSILSLHLHWSHSSLNSSTRTKVTFGYAVTCQSIMATEMHVL